MAIIASGEVERVPLSNVRKTIARRLTEAWQIPVFQLQASADMTQANALVAKLRDEKAGFPEAANHRLKALRQLFAWACLPAYRYANKNPARDVTYLKSNNPDGIPAWSEADAARYEARHPIGTKARLAFDLLLYTGVRRSDAVRLGPQMEVLWSETMNRRD